jgi:hypothetical protein
VPARIQLAIQTSLRESVVGENTNEDHTAANPFLTAGGALTDDGKKLVLERMHSKFLAHHLLELFTESARQVIEQQSALFMWTSGNRHEAVLCTTLHSC